MTNVYRLPVREEATGKASEWLARLDRGLIPDEVRELRSWFEADPDNASALIEVAQLWDQMDSLSRLADLFPKPEPRRARRVRLTLALAMSAIIAATTAWLVWAPADKSGETQAAVQLVAAPSSYRQFFETAVGEHSTVMLPDGSELTLNTNSRVRAEFSGSMRTLNLEQGEVYVKVAHDEAKPFVVRARDRIVRAIGTAFNVEIKQDQRVEIIVSEGKVMIGVADADANSFEPAWLESMDTSLVAGQRATLGESAPRIEDIDAEEIDVKLSWREGNIVFRGEPLADALDEIGRYTRVEFVIRDEELKSIRVAGLFRAGDVDGLLATLRENFNISYERLDDQTIVLHGE